MSEACLHGGTPTARPSKDKKGTAAGVIIGIILILLHSQDYSAPGNLMNDSRIVSNCIEWRLGFVFMSDRDEEWRSLNESHHSTEK